jgi:hypothetical protein
MPSKDIYSTDKFIKNKYLKYYQLIIESAKAQNRIKRKICDENFVYYESHHILPQSIFPEYRKDKWNVVLLTAKEHYICHRLLAKFTFGENYYKMLLAICMFSKISSEQQRTLNSRQYELIKCLYSEYHSFTKKGNKNFFYGKKHTEVSRSKMRGSRPSFKTENNVNFLGNYITPFGITNKRDGFKQYINGRTLARYCKNSNDVITKNSYYSSNYLKNNHNESIIGKTFSDIGFGFSYKS